MLEDFQNDIKVNLLEAVKTKSKYFNNFELTGRAGKVSFITVTMQTRMLYQASITSAKLTLERLSRTLAAEFATSICVSYKAP